MFSVRKCAERRAWGVHEGGGRHTDGNATRRVRRPENPSVTGHDASRRRGVRLKVQKKIGINYDDPAGILCIRETPRQYEILLCVLHIDVSSHIVVYFAAGRFVYLPNPEPSDISIWCTLW